MMEESTASSLTLALGQMNIALGDPETNLDTVRRLTAEAAARGAQVVLFPELWGTGYDLTHASRYASSLDEGLFAETAALARRHGLYLIGSNLERLAPERFANTLTVFSPRGELLASYAKVHLFRLMDEHHHLSPGERLVVADLPWGKAGLAICYDLRFPEMFRAYALAGAKMVFLPAEWPHPRLSHWRTLLRARAIENQMFVVACNRVGSDGRNEFFGHSCVIDPWGETLVEAAEEETLLTVTIPLDEVERVRAKIPVFGDRRPEVYTWSEGEKQV